MAMGVGDWRETGYGRGTNEGGFWRAVTCKLMKSERLELENHDAVLHAGIEQGRGVSLD